MNLNGFPTVSTNIQRKPAIRDEPRQKIYSRLYKIIHNVEICQNVVEEVIENNTNAIQDSTFCAFCIITEDVNYRRYQIQFQMLSYLTPAWNNQQPETAFCGKK